MKTKLVSAIICMIIVVSFGLVAWCFGISGKTVICTTPYTVGSFSSLERAGIAADGMIKLLKLEHPQYSYSYIEVDESILKEIISSLGKRRPGFYLNLIFF